MTRKPPPWWEGMDPKVARRVTARKHEGDDYYSWAVFVDGRAFVTGLAQTQVRYYKRQALRLLIQEADDKSRRDT